MRVSARADRRAMLALVFIDHAASAQTPMSNARRRPAAAPGAAPNATPSRSPPSGAVDNPDPDEA
jgi:hypothetical protein